LSGPDERKEAPMPRVVILSGVYPNMRCGVAHHTWAVAQALAELGRWDVHILTTDHPDVSVGRERSFGLHPVVKGWGVSRLPDIVRAVARLRPDVLHLQTPTAAYAGRACMTMPMLPLAGRRLWNRTRLVVTQHDLAVGHRVMQSKHMMLLKKADAVTVSNDRDRTVALRHAPAMSDRLHVARVGSHFRPPVLTNGGREELRREFGVPDDGIMLLYFGFVVPGRKLETLLHAAAQLKERGVRLRLVLVGGTGPGCERYAASCRSLTADLGLESEVLWTGYAEPRMVESALAAADLFIAAIERGADCRNSSILAAMEAGVPVLTTENPRYGTDRELRAGGQCRFFDACDPASLADTVEDALADGGALERMRGAARRTAARHTWDEHIRVLEMAYRGEPPEAYDPCEPDVLASDVGPARTAGPATKGHE